MNFSVRLFIDVLKEKNQVIKDIGGGSIIVGFGFLSFVIIWFAFAGFNGYLIPSLWVLSLSLVAHLFSTAMKLADHGL